MCECKNMQMDAPRVMEVIGTSLTRRGKGVEGDPLRCITQYYCLHGVLLAEIDPHPKQL